MNIRLAADADRDAWNIYVKTHPEVPPLVRYEWRTILERAYRVPTYFFLAEDDGGAVKGICATYVTKPWGGKPMLYSLRFGLLADGEAVGQALLSHIRNFCSTQGIGAYLVTSGYNLFQNDKVETKKTVGLCLLDSEKEMWNSLRNKTRNMIRKAQKAGLIVERGFENVEAFYRIYAKRMLEKGVPIHSLAFFKQTIKELKDFAELLVVKRGGMPVGGLLLLVDKHTAIYPYQASLPEGEQYASNQLLIWEAMHLCHRRGITMLDMGESKEGSSVYQSKLNFGGTPRDVYYYSFGGNGSPSILSAMSQILFARAPFWVRKKIGPWIKQQGRVI